VLDGEGGFTVWGRLAPVAAAPDALPIGLAHGVRLRRDIPEDGVLKLDDVDLAEDAVLALYREAMAG
jgi:predicted homoserine dehydrogenase-like protein